MTNKEIEGSIPVWWVIVQQATLVQGMGVYANRIIKAVKCELKDVDRLYRENSPLIYTNPGYQTMLFTREPDETPVKEWEHRNEQLL